MSVRIALHSSVRSALYVVAFVLALVLLVVVLVFGAILALAYPNRRPGFSYFASRTKPSDIEANKFPA
jgi:hypothetical protein